MLGPNICESVYFLPWKNVGLRVARRVRNTAWLGASTNLRIGVSAIKQLVVKATPPNARR